MDNIVLIITDKGKFVGRIGQSDPDSFMLTDAVLVTEAMSNRGPILFGSYLGVA